jgi:hypothetical protein
MKEEKESQRGYSQLLLASLGSTENQSCAARFGKSFFSELLARFSTCFSSRRNRN